MTHVRFDPLVSDAVRYRCTLLFADVDLHGGIVHVAEYGDMIQFSYRNGDNVGSLSIATDAFVFDTFVSECVEYLIEDVITN